MLKLDLVDNFLKEKMSVMLPSEPVQWITDSWDNSEDLAFLYR
jgi:hypothetical protein